MWEEDVPDVTVSLGDCDWKFFITGGHGFIRWNCKGKSHEKLQIQFNSVYL